MYSHLKERSYYDDIYDHSTVDMSRIGMKSFHDFRDKWLEKMPDNEENKFRNPFHLNLIYMLMVGNDLVKRYDERDHAISVMMADDEAKDAQIVSARLTSEPTCQHCSKTGLRITDKTLMTRNDNDEVLLMLKCPHCNMNSAYWEDGAAWERRETYCPKCNAIMESKSTRRGKVITTTYLCSSCRHSYKDKLDLKQDEIPEDSDYEKDRRIYCLIDEKNLKEHRDAKQRYEGMARLMKDIKEKEDNKHIYDAVASLHKIKIAELTNILSPILEKNSYIEISFDKPEIGKDVFVGFSCLDGKADRDDSESRKTLEKTINEALLNTNWRLMSDGIHYRLGYLSGRVRAYEREEDLKALVMKDRKLHSNRKSPSSNKNNIRKIKDKNGNDVIL